MVQTGVPSGRVRGAPTRKRASSSMGRCVAERPMRVGGRSQGEGSVLGGIGRVISGR